MKYKALLLDVDGTLIPYEYDVLPSQNVIKSIQKAVKKGIIVCLVTGRAYESTKHILDVLGLHEGVVVTNAGGGVFEIKNGNPLRLQPMESSDVDFAIKTLRQHKVEFWVKNGMYDGSHRGSFKLRDPHDEVYMIFSLEEYDEKVIDTIHKKFESRPHVAFYKTKHKNPQNTGLNISHVNATKLHGVEVLMKHYNLKREEIIGVGDAYNDFPLLMASGLKIAMGNALDDLKAIADYTAPSVADDGVAWVVDTFIEPESA